MRRTSSAKASREASTTLKLGVSASIEAASACGCQVRERDDRCCLSSSAPHASRGRQPRKVSYPQHRNSDDAVPRAGAWLLRCETARCDHSNHSGEAGNLAVACSWLSPQGQKLRFEAAILSRRAVRGRELSTVM